ncbi:MAG: TIM-barrel domain-containing protein [Gemmatimonadaceae bacterium]
MPAQYHFLGDLRSYQRIPSGVTLRCTPGMELRLRFLTTTMVRVTLQRPGHDEPLLEHAIAKTNWAPVAVRVTENAHRLEIRSDSAALVVHRRPCRTDLLDADGTPVVEHDSAMAIGWDGNEVRSWQRIAEGERFFGLGEKTGQLDKGGKEWVLWNSDNFGYGAETDPLYQSIPFFVGIRAGLAYGIYLNNSSRTTFNFGAGNHRYYSFAADQGPLDYVLISGPSVGQVVAAYTELTGRMPVPPKWALGYQQSRWSYTPADEVLRIARTFREKRIPADVLYLDIDYMDGYRVFTWDRERFPDPPRMLRQLGAMGFKIVTIIDPGVKEDTTYQIAREGLAGEHFVRYPDRSLYVGSVWPGRTYFPDFSRPETRRWWGGHLGRLIESGVDGIWNDMNEPAVWGKAFPLEVVMADGGRGSSQKRMHNLYGLLMSRAAYEELRRARPDERPFVLTRAGFAGIQRYSAVWTGDNVASWDHLGLGIRMLQGMGVSGVPFVGTDVGGFVGTPSPELFARWVQVGAYSPFFRTHTSANTADQEPWSFGEQVEEISRTFITRRYRLLPYLYSLFWEAHRSGAPPMRPLFWHHQRDSMVYRPEYQQQFLLGERLLVAPVTREGATMARVYLPAGRWLDLDTDSVYQGGRSVVVDAPLERLPTFLAAGGILPTQEPVQYVGDAGPDALTIDAFAGDGPEYFDLYEDDGKSHAYERGGYLLTRFEVVRRGGEIVVKREVRHAGYELPARKLRLRLHAVAAAPQMVTLDGRRVDAVADEQAEGYGHDAGRRIVTVRVREAGSTQELRIRTGGP